MSPILVRPVREQLEHDRVIRLLQAKYKRKFEAAMNPGHEQHAAVLVGTSPWYPDLVLYTQDRARKLAGTVEVETAESVNHLEAMSQWKTFAQQRAPFHLYVPVVSIDNARRMATEFQIEIAEIWAYSSLGEQMRFTLVQKQPGSEVKPKAAAPESRAARPAAAAPPARPVKSAAAAKPAAVKSKAAPAKPSAKTAKKVSGNGAARRPPVAAAKARRKASAAPGKAPVRGAAAKKTAARAQKRK